MGGQLDLKKNRRYWVLVRLGDKMRCECVYDGVGVGQEVVGADLRFAMAGECQGYQEKEALFNYSGFF